jgi:hypothetical protein
LIQLKKQHETNFLKGFTAYSVDEEIDVAGSLVG